MSYTHYVRHVNFLKDFRRKNVDQYVSSKVPTFVTNPGMKRSTSTVFTNFSIHLVHLLTSSDVYSPHPNTVSLSFRWTPDFR